MSEPTLSIASSSRIITLARRNPVEPRFTPVDRALDALRSGQAIVVVDDEKRENEGDLICAAEFATPTMINFMATQARGLICLAMTGDRLDELQLPPMVEKNGDHHQTAFTVSIDAAPHHGVTTGISASDRSRTIQVALSPTTTPDDLSRPGHIFPLRARAGGVFERAGHTEAAVDLARLAGLYPAGIICEIQNPNGSMARLPELMSYADEYGLAIIRITDLIRYREGVESSVSREAIARLPTEFGEFNIYAYRDLLDGSEATAIIKGDPDKFADRTTLVRIHSQCFTGDVLGSSRCDCRQQLHIALKSIETAGQGVVVYLPQEGRGVGLINKLKAYSLQDLGLDTVDANRRLGFEADGRTYRLGAHILKDLGVADIRLLTNNPQKVQGLRDWGINIVERIPLVMPPNYHNQQYLLTKREKLGHLLPFS